MTDCCFCHLDDRRVLILRKIPPRTSSERQAFKESGWRKGGGFAAPFSPSTYFQNCHFEGVNDWGICNCKRISHEKL